MPINRSQIAINKDFPSERVQRLINPGLVHYLFNDPSTPDLAADLPVPATPLPVAIGGYVGGGQPIGSAGGQAASCAVTIGTCLSYIASRSKKAITHWAAIDTLMVLPRAGEDLNAYYDRQALQFFYITDPVTHKLIFSCDSADVVAHELGHAILDILRPDFWNTQSFEIFAFHEAFGDCTAILCIMQHDQMLAKAIEETGGNFMQSNIISRLAEEMGAAACHLSPPQAGYNPGYLRNAVNSFKYVEPETLPDHCPDNLLCKECHNFSRVWTGAWYEFMVKVYMRLSASMDRMSALKQARDLACDYLLSAIIDAPATYRLFDALARQMLVVDNLRGNIYRDILLEVFNGRNILRDQVTMQAVVHFDNFVAGEGTVDIQNYDNGKNICVKKTKVLKMSNHMGGVSALDYNPLYELNIEVPMDKTYFFGADGMLQSATVNNEEEAIEAARQCLIYLHNNALVGPDPKTPFEVANNHLVRTHVCGCGCQTNNACIKGAPEYQKGYKGNNNAGCGCKGCGKIPVCDCETEEPTLPSKLGCYVRSKTGGTTKYTKGFATSRKVC